MRTIYFANYRLEMEDAVAERISCPLTAFVREMETTHTISVRAGDPRETEERCRAFAEEKPVCDPQQFRIYRNGTGWALLAPGTGYSARTLLLCSPDYGENILFADGDGLIPFMRTICPVCETAMACRGGLPLHAALVELDGMGLLFLAPSGVGKSTQALLWQNELGAKFLSGDRPGVRKKNGEWIGYSMPWDGKDDRRSQDHVKIRAIITLSQADHNAISRLTTKQAMAAMLKQTFLPMWDGKAMEACLSQMSELTREIPFWHLENTADAESVRMTLAAVTGEC